MYALKRLKNLKRRGRFEREVITMEKLHDQGIAIPEIVEKDLGADRPWFAMPWFEGGSLEDAVVDGRYRGDRSAGIAALIELASIVLAVHETGFSHRDLKPSNVLFGGSGLLLTDFGLCLELDSEEARLTLPDEPVGSRLYIAPENENGMNHDLDQRPADGYAFGKMIWALLAGRQPLTREQVLEPDQRLEALLADHSLRPVDRLIRDLLNRDPRARLSDFAVVRAELEAIGREKRPGEVPVAPVSDKTDAIAQRLEQLPLVRAALEARYDSEARSAWVFDVQRAMSARIEGLEESLPNIRGSDGRELLWCHASNGGYPADYRLATSDFAPVRDMVPRPDQDIPSGNEGWIVFVITSPSGVSAFPVMTIRVWLRETTEGWWINRVPTVDSMDGGGEVVASFLAPELAAHIGPFPSLRQTTLERAVDMVDESIPLFRSMIAHYLEIIDEGGDPSEASAWEGRSFSKL